MRAFLEVYSTPDYPEQARRMGEKNFPVLIVYPGERVVRGIDIHISTIIT